MTTEEKLKRHFGGNPVVWVAAWGISKLRKRGGRFAGSIAGEALWFDEWYDRVMSKETAVRLADLGVNLVALPFSVGGDDATEKEERDDFERMTSFLHENGITSLPYLQYQNILQETFTFPETEWAVKLDGGRTEYCYWRRTVCQSSRPFIEYFKGLVADAVKRDADGIWIDNNYLRPCKCDSCVSAFKKYLSANRRDLLGELYFKDFEKVEIPSHPGYLEHPVDPIAQAFIDFNCERNMHIHVEVKEHLEALSPAGLFCSNPALYRGKSLVEIGVDYKRIVQLNDLVYLENKLFPQVKGGHASGNFRGYISSNACGSIAVPGAWKREDFDSTSGVPSSGMPETQNEIERVLYEASAFNGAIGMLWAIRTRPLHTCASADDLLTMYLEWPQIYPHMKQCISFIKSLPCAGKRKNLANVAVLYHRESLAFNHSQSFPTLHCVEDFLMENRTPYEALFSENLEKIGNYRLVVLPETSLLKDGEAEILRQYVKGGGKLVVLGYPGVYNERFRPRKDSVLKDVLNASVFKVPANLLLNNYHAGGTLFVPNTGKTKERIINMMSANEEIRYPLWTEQREQLSKAFHELLGSDQQLFIEGKGTLGVSFSKQENGSVAVHVVSYEDTPAPQSLKISIAEDLLGGTTGRWLTPDGGESHINAVRNNGHLVFEVSGFRVYGVFVSQGATAR